MKILLLDIETAPNVAHVWGLWQQNVGLPQIIASGYVLCWAAKWYGEKTVMFDSVLSGHKKMIRGIHRLLQEADAVAHYNGARFDVPTLNKEFLCHNMTPPSPYKQIDLLRVARSKFRFPSNKLDYVSRVLGFGQKVKHKGHELWIECMAKNPQAWKQMEAYNRHDVVLLEKVYTKMLPWINNHPNHGVYDKTAVCPNCAGYNFQRRGWDVRIAMRYPRYQCNDCGKWFRGQKSDTQKNIERFTAVPT
jgi:hypothetical protein